MPTGHPHGKDDYRGVGLHRQARAQNSSRDAAVSEIMGTILLISIVVLAVSVIAVVLFSQPHAQGVPSFSAIISSQGQNVYVKNDGGDALQNGTYRILVDGTDVTANINLPDTWSIGNTLSYTKPGTSAPTIVQIVYTGAGSTGTVLASANFGSLNGAATTTATVTATATATTTGTTTTATPSPTATTSTTATTTATPTPVPAPVANFAATPSSGTAPLAVAFSDTSTGTPTIWSWTFGDTGSGNTSSLQNPTHTYTTAGTYTVTLKVSNAGGNSSATKTITVNATPPKVTSISPNSGKHNTNIAVAITGTGFQTAGTTSVLLISDDTQRSTQISGSSISVTNSTYLTCSFSLPNGAYTGTYDIQVTNPDSQTGTLSAGFTVT